MGGKKQKRPPAEGVVRPKRTPKRKPAKDRRASARTVRWTAGLVAVLAPLLIVGLMVGAGNPDVAAPCTVAAVVVLVAALGGLMVVRTSGWVLWPGVLLGIVMLALPTAVFRAEVTAHRAVRTDVVVTWVHEERDRRGHAGWKCGIRRPDGQPVPHGEFVGSGCSGPQSTGATATVLLDPDGWVPPAGTDLDLAFLSEGAYAVGAAALLWALMTVGAARRTLRESPPRAERR
ncbi:hypothetical protein F7Q99_27020 [Streptomyces kaniharaensis]|uniref:DUF3592 domain-containing protein n=1 Tax=Streptomyces kaniharaensis TaxID=212423 RepID=A0A6N7KWC4_9ACTN|nr:hypothetical protein [Streptomyces kaniharaensis]MQS15820.1 hypothetical protein [Streptomyces kaniharaensis]